MRQLMGCYSAEMLVVLSGCRPGACNMPLRRDGRKRSTCLTQIEVSAYNIWSGLGWGNGHDVLIGEEG